MITLSRIALLILCALSAFTAENRRELISEFSLGVGPTPDQTAQTAKVGFWTDLTAGVLVRRFRDRAFIGDGAASSGQWTASASESWLKTSLAYWPEQASQLLALSYTGGIAASFASRTSDYDLAHPTATIGIAAFGINDGSNSIASWAGYFEAVRGALCNSAAYGMEIPAKNLGADITSTPYLRLGWGAIGIWLPGGGDASYGGVPTNPSATAIMIGKNAQPWNKGIIFNADSITGTDGTTGTGIAIDMAAGHIINWTNPSGSTSATIYSASTTSGHNMGIKFEDDSIRCTGNGGVSAFRIDSVSSAANYLAPRNAVAAADPSIVAAGSDTDIGITFTPKGAGQVKSSGDVVITTAGKGLSVKSGSNARCGTATLSGGTIVVANTSVTASTRVLVTVSTAGGTQGFLRTSKSAGVSFTITSTSGTETSTVDWLLVENP